MRILVSGASGFIGSGLVAALHADGHEVFALMRESASTEFLKGVPFTRVSGDLREIESLKRACTGMDAVIHLAGVTSARDREEYFRYNAEGTKNLSHAALEAGTIKRFIYISSLAASGPSVGLAPKTEADIDLPVSMYGESKLRGELYLDELKGQLPYIVLRPPMVYGPRDKNVFLFFKSIQKNWLPLLPARTPTGHKYYSTLYVNDLIQAIKCSLTADEIHFKNGERYFLSDGHIYTLDRIMALISQELKVNPIKIKVPAPLVALLAQAGTWVGNAIRKNLPLNRDKLNELLPDYWICSPEKATRDLGFEPKTPFESGVVETTAWYKIHGWL